MSDCWKSYDCLNSQGFQHLKVNHSINFVDPDTGKYTFKNVVLQINNINIILLFVLCAGAHTQHIERVWREVRANIPRYGTRSSHLVGYLAEFLFKRAHKYEERLNSFFCAIAELYSPKTYTKAEVSEAETK